MTFQCDILSFNLFPLNINSPGNGRDEENHNNGFNEDSQCALLLLAATKPVIGLSKETR